MKTSFSNPPVPVRETLRSRQGRAVSLFISLLALAFASRTAHAGTYLTPVLDGSLDSWTGVPVAYTGGVGSGAPDFNTIQVANDSNYLYLGISFATPLDLQFSSGGSSVYLAFDTDNNTSTGFDVFSAGAIGSELGYQNDFPFQQAAGNFNTGATISGSTALIAPYDSSSTSAYEIAIPLNANIGGTPLWNSTPGTTIGLAVYIDDGLQYGPGFTGPTDFTADVNYTFADAVPEPGGYAFAVAGIALLLCFRRFFPRRRAVS